jgi:pilus assembly protein CpaC
VKCVTSRILLATALGFALWMAVAAGASAQRVVPLVSEPLVAPNDVPPRTIAVPVNKVHLVDLPEPVRDIIVANPEIVDVIVQTTQQAYLIARSLGTTNLFFIGQDGSLILHLAVQVEIDLSALRAAIRSLMPDANIEFNALNDNIVITGTVRSAKESADVHAIARRFVEEDTSVINMLRVLEDQQVLLKVRIAEFQRSVLKNLGVETTFNKVIRGGRNISFTTAGGTAFATAVSGIIGIDYKGLGQTAFTALERQGLVKTLAEPTLTAISGQTANFLAGGEFPVPAGLDSQGNLLIEFRDFGVSLSFTPVVLSGNQISLRVATEVSRQAKENKLVLPFGTNNQTVDVIGLSVRRADSTVNMPSGGSLMIAGLLQADEFNQIEGMPWLKDLPILGALFRSTEFQRNETELVIIVEAFLVRPIGEGQELALPTDGFVPASDFDLYIMGRLYKQYAKPWNPDNVPTLRGPFGYIME